MSTYIKDSGWQELRGTVQRCDACGRSTMHLAARGGVAVCGTCGYNPSFEQISDEDEPRDNSWIVHLPPRRGRRASR